MRLSPTMAAASSGRGGSEEAVIDLSVGEPRCAPPPEVCEAIERALRDGPIRYGPAAGLPELRARIAEQHATRTGNATDPEEVIVTAGGKPAIADALRVVLEPGDEVLIPSPCWPTFAMQVEWCRGHPIIVPGVDAARSDGRLAELFRSVISSRTRAIIINSPVNPTAEVWSRSDLQIVAEFAAGHDLWVISDEVYRELAPGGDAPELIEASPDASTFAVVVESFSKRFAMTGYRVGWAVGPPMLIDAMIRLQSSTTTHPSTLSQHAGLAALTAGGEWLCARRNELGHRRRCAVELLRGVPGVQCPEPAGGMFVFPDVRELLDRYELGDDRRLCDLLARQAGVCLVPGSVFHGAGHVRVSVDVEEAVLEAAVARLRAWRPVDG